MINKHSKLYSIITFTCPHCHEGKFFCSSPYSFKNSGKVKEKCSECGGVFQKETGFYFGAMYVSYAIGVALFIALFISLWVLFPELSTTVTLLIILLHLIILAPLIYSLSKIIWANIFFTYNPKNKS